MVSPGTSFFMNMVNIGYFTFFHNTYLESNRQHSEKIDSDTSIYHPCYN